ncbi:hypothetical protein ElyMa_002005700 [Elysia marginata]|uniref:DUF6451 domain-containing protein n=1 Tax=Elysia marginata TaxID=1093978 RepID=A0AAV4F3U3_9GAST|nr:hypothetical protein ElyMa_002005700 [Elysia marginata]
MRTNNNQKKNIKEVQKFVYLGSVVSKHEGTDRDIKSRINKARHAFNTLQHIWRATTFTLHNKICIYNSNVKSVWLYGSDTWRVTKTNTLSLQKFINRCLTNVLNVRWPEVVSNKEECKKCNKLMASTQIKKRKCGWIGNTFR